MEIRGNKRKYYNKPQISRINLVMDEAVLTPCKTAIGDTSGKLGTGNSGCNGNSCQNIQGS